MRVNRPIAIAGLLAIAGCSTGAADIDGGLAPSATPAVHQSPVAHALDLTVAERRALLDAADPDLRADVAAAAAAAEGEPGDADPLAFTALLAERSAALGPTEREALLMEVVTFADPEVEAPPAAYAAILDSASATCEGLDAGDDYWEVAQTVQSGIGGWDELGASTDPEEADGGGQGAEDVEEQLVVMSAAFAGVGVAYIVCPQHSATVLSAVEESWSQLAESEGALAG